MSPLARLAAALAGSALVAACGGGGGGAAMPAPAPPPPPPASAQSWLAGQAGSSGLLASFEGGHVAYTYDQAVACIAFLVSQDRTRARALLDRLQSLQEVDGAFRDAYDSATGVPQEYSRTVGPTLWVAIAVMNYEKLTGDTTTYRAMATRAIDWSLQFQQPDGGLDGGLDASGAPDAWASTEHNLDAYAAFTHFGYAAPAARVKAFLDDVAWSTDHFLPGRPNGDTTDPLDVEAWGVMALGVNGTHPYHLGLTHAMNAQRTTQALSGVSYDAFDFDANRNDIWFEGSSFMVIALNLYGDTTDASHFLGQIVKDQSANGGVQYSLLGTHNGYWTMSDRNAISSTGWLILASANYNPLSQ